jgi:hypothetical protein
MRNMTKKQMPDGALVRTLITAIVMTGWMVVTGCSYLKQPDAQSRQATVCFDQGRSGYWCPDASSTMATNLPEEQKEQSKVD